MNHDRYLDDFTQGERFVTSGVTLTESEIIDFALKYDPQPFHLDKVAAESSLFEGLIASGYQTLSLCFRMFIQSGILESCSMGSPGIDELRWYAPVRPNNTLHTEVEVVEVKPSRSKPEMGILRLQYEAFNDKGEKVLSFIVNHFVKRRPE